MDVKEAGRRGGMVKSEAKAMAVRENGKKGGRPPKTRYHCHGCGKFLVYDAEQNDAWCHDCGREGSPETGQ